MRKVNYFLLLKMDQFDEIRQSIKLEKLIDQYMCGDGKSGAIFNQYVDQYLSTDPPDKMINRCFSHVLWHGDTIITSSLLKRISQRLDHDYINQMVVSRGHRPMEVFALFNCCGADNYEKLTTENLGWRHIELAEYFLLNHGSKFTPTSVQVIQLLESGKGLVLNTHPGFLCFHLAKPYKARHNEIAKIISEIFPRMYKDVLDTILLYVLYEKN